jgi:uncharacterized protein (TIGR02145 family)
MVENLRLDDTAIITTTNTHNPLTANNSVALTIDYANNTTANHLAASNNTWCTDYDATCYDQTILNTNNTNRSLTASYSGTGNSTYYQWYGYGNYYNWYSATAGNGTYSFSTNNNSVNGDLCPAGWRLPIGGQTTVNATGDFYVLTKTLMGGTEPNKNNTNGHGYYSGIVDGVDLGAKVSKSLSAFPSNFVFSGYFNDSSAINRGWSGRYWSDSALSSHLAYYLYLGYTDVNPGNERYYKYSGSSVRCIAQ